MTLSEEAGDQKPLPPPKEVEKPKIFLGVPRGAQPRLHEFEANLREILLGLQMQGFASCPLILERRSCRVDNNRNAICEQFLKSNGEYLVMLDDDMVYPIQAPQVLAWKLGKLRRAESKAGILCGTYFHRRGPPHPLLYKNPRTTWSEGRNEWVTEHDWMDDEVAEFLENHPKAHTDDPVTLWDEGGTPLLQSLTPISAGGTGFICIHREVLEGTPRPWFREMGRKPGESGAHGGDLAFFKRARLAGFAAWADVGLIAAHYDFHPTGAGAFLRDRGTASMGEGPGNLRGAVAEQVPLDAVEMNGGQPGALGLDHPWNIGEAAFSLIVDLIDKYAARTILEFGSGKSTIRMALEFPGAEIHAIEHNEEYFKMVKQMGIDHEVQADLALHLVPLGADNGYDISGLDLPEEFDFIFIDGPPSNVNGGRFKAMEDAVRLVKLGGLIVMNDVRHGPEQEAARIAMSDDDEYAFEYRNVSVGHGVAVLRKVERDGSEVATTPRVALAR
jgi:predicted O-methyltransferase YrrM